MVPYRVSINRDAITAFCQRWRIAELAFFGSVLRDDFRPDSDIDVLVAFDPAARWSLFDHQTMEEELSGIVGRRVDLVSRRGLERSRNPLRRQTILDSAEIFYAAG